MLKKYETISLDEVESVALLKLNRPEKLNAFNMQMFHDMLSAIDHVNNDDNIKSLIITGSGRAFCAGADLSLGEKTFDKNFDTSDNFESDFRIFKTACFIQWPKVLKWLDKIKVVHTYLLPPLR